MEFGINNFLSSEKLKGMKIILEMNGKYIYHSMHSSDFFYFCILKAKTGVKKDILYGIYAFQ
jgi:hypothetical protein